MTTLNTPAQRSKIAKGAGLIMNIDIGIIGLPKSGRTTIFNALTRGQADTGGHSQEGSPAHIGTAKVSEPRLQGLADILHPKRVVPVSVTYIDVGASIKGLVEERGIGGELLNRLSKVDALINVVRAFENPSVPHHEGSLNIERDITNMNLELAFSDLAIMERRLERIETSLKGAKPPQRQNLLREQEVLARIKAELERDIPVREMGLAPEEARLLSNFQLLTAKPLLIVVNIGEDQLPGAASLEAQLNSAYSRPGCRVIALCGKLEMELAQLEDEAAQGLRREYGLTESGAERVVKASYELLELVSFFTIASNEVRAWPVPSGTEAVKAAGKIHSDMERGFIRAEVISYQDLVRCGSLSEARKKGLLRMEGKNYIVQDGDVITFLFNV